MRSHIFVHHATTKYFSNLTSSGSRKPVLLPDSIIAVFQSHRFSSTDIIPLRRIRVWISPHKRACVDKSNHLPWSPNRKFATSEFWEVTC
jgi:hypothetical protein